MSRNGLQGCITYISLQQANTSETHSLLDILTAHVTGTECNAIDTVVHRKHIGAYEDQSTLSRGSDLRLIRESGQSCIDEGSTGPPLFVSVLRSWQEPVR